MRADHDIDRTRFESSESRRGFLPASEAGELRDTDRPRCEPVTERLRMLLREQRRPDVEEVTGGAGGHVVKWPVLCWGCGKPVWHSPDGGVDPFGCACSDRVSGVLEAMEGAVDGGGGHASGVRDGAEGSGGVAGAGAEGEPGEGGEDTGVVVGGLCGAPAPGGDAERGEHPFDHVDDAGELAEVLLGAVLWRVSVEAGALERLLVSGSA